MRENRVFCPFKGSFLRVIPDLNPYFLSFLSIYTDSAFVIEKFIEKGIKASAARARKALQEIAGACKERRKEITATKEAMEAKK